MGEGIKQVRVDNWGIYFLQRLQMFFSRTDYCDLTLQFEGNVQLKVHRLVMNACTEYFTFLEQTCPIVEDNTIVMPEDLQSDVIVPIVNFMYTGMLEFHMSIYEKIYRAAELMDMPILIKVLEAQRQPVAKALPEKKKKEPFINTWTAPKRTPPKPEPVVQTPLKKPAIKRRVTPSMSTNDRSWLPDPLAISDPPTRHLDNTPKPTRFEWPEDIPMMMDNSFSDISLTSQPLLTKEEENRVVVSSSQTKRAVKENEESEEPSPIFGEEEEPVNVNTVNQKRKVDQQATKSSPKRAKVSDKENKETTINIKSNSIGDLDHTKIVSEILKKYPDLVKKNKNIRLKIMSPTSKTPDKATVVKTASIKVMGQIPKAKERKQSPALPPSAPLKPKPAPKEKPTSNEGPWICNKCATAGETQEFGLYYLYRKHMQDTHHVVFASNLCKFCGKKCLDENVMTYHLYTKHGYKSSSGTSFPKCDLCPYVAISVAKLIKHHGSHKPQERQCNTCKLAFTSDQALAMHIQITDHREKNVRASSECQYCSKKTYSAIGLLLHVKTSHLKEGKRDGIVINLKDLERMEEPDCEESEEEEEEYITPDGIDQQDKVKIISNVKVPSNQQQQQQEPKQQSNATVVPHLEPSSEAEALNNVASGIATSLGLVDIVVLDEKGQYVLGNRAGGTAEYVLPDLTSSTAQNFVGGRVVTTTDGDIQPAVLQSTTQEVSSTDELVMVLTDHDYQEETEATTQDNSNIVVLYSHPVDGQQSQFITSQGNLLVNSQTGMLELRNGSTMTTASSNQLIVTSATDSPVESIEMIQREINTHAPTKNQTYLQTPKPVEVHGQDMPDIGEEPTAASLSQETAVQVEEKVAAAEEEQQSEATAQAEVSQSEETVQIQEAGQEGGEDAQKDVSNEDAVQESMPEANEPAHENIAQPEQEHCAENPEEPNEDVADGRQTDSTDSGAAIIAEEPMEIDEPTKEVVEPPKEPVAVAEPSQEVETVEEQQDVKEEEEEGVDVPPDTQDGQASQEVVINDPSLLNDSHDWEQNQVEAMEVDGRIGDSTEMPPKENDESDGLPEEKRPEESAGNGGQQDPQAGNEEPVAETEPGSRVEAEVEDEDDTTQTSTTSSQDQNKTQTAILEDWEDTDSQQSERPNAAARLAQASQRQEDEEEEDEDIDVSDDEEKTKRNVDKLMVDWQDEEDEEKK